jgi:hypothetical protein
MSDEQLRQAFVERVPDPGTAQEYRRKVEAMIQEKERWMRRGYWAAGAGYVVALLVAIALMLGAGLWFEGQPRQLWLGVNACFYLVLASVMAFNYLMTRNRVEMLKELKGIEMRVIEIQQRLEKP